MAEQKEIRNKYIFYRPHEHLGLNIGSNHGQTCVY